MGAIGDESVRADGAAHTNYLDALSKWGDHSTVNVHMDRNLGQVKDAKNRQRTPHNLLLSLRTESHSLSSFQDHLYGEFDWSTSGEFELVKSIYDEKERML